MAKRKLRKPKPGIYHDVPFADYQAWPYVNNSSLGPAIRSGLHYELSLQAEPRKATAEMDLGSLVHCLVLEPHAEDERFAVEPDFTEEVRFQYRAPERSAEYKGLRARWLKENRGKIIVTSEMHQTALACAAAARGQIQPFLLSGETEVCAVANCPETGMRLKARLDLLSADIIFDVKTTRNAAEFEDEIAKFNYHRQAAFYQDVMEPHAACRLPVWLVAVETSEPFLARMAPVDEAAIEEGRRDVMRALRNIVRHGGYENPFKWRLPRDKHVVDVLVKGKHYEIGR